MMNIDIMILYCGISNRRMWLCNEGNIMMMYVCKWYDNNIEEKTINDNIEDINMNENEINNERRKYYEEENDNVWRIWRNGNM